MHSSSNSKRRRVDKKQPQKDVHPTQKSRVFITKLSVKLIACIFDFLKLQDLVYCQQTNKLFRSNSLKAIQADQEKYAMYCAKQNNLDVDFRSKEVLLETSKVDKKNQNTQNELEHASENDQTESISSLALISSRVDKLVESGNKIKNVLRNQASIEYILENLVDVVTPDKIFGGLEGLKQPNDDDTFISIEFPDSVIQINTAPRTKITADAVLRRAGIKYCDMKSISSVFNMNIGFAK